MLYFSRNFPTLLAPSPFRWQGYQAQRAEAEPDAERQSVSAALWHLELLMRPA
ncbi:MAG: hypothetical protein AAFR26_17940 [Cyanobacteria bacterium J06626_4]